MDFSFFNFLGVGFLGVFFSRPATTAAGGGLTIDWWFLQFATVFSGAFSNSYTSSLPPSLLCLISVPSLSLPKAYPTTTTTTTTYLSILISFPFFSFFFLFFFLFLRADWCLGTSTLRVRVPCSALKARTISSSTFCHLTFGVLLLSPPPPFWDFLLSYLFNSGCVTSINATNIWLY